MDPKKILLIADMVMTLAGKLAEAKALYDRAKAGETISDEEIHAGQAKVEAAVAAWDAAAGNATVTSGGTMPSAG